MNTSTKLWLGFGTLVALLLASVLLMFARLRSVESGLQEQVNVARPRLGTTGELESHLLRYVLEVRNFVHLGDPRARREAAVSSTALERELTVYDSFANTERRRQMATTFASRWNEVKDLGQILLETREKNQQPTLEDLTRLRALRVDLERFLQTEMRQEALDAFNARKETTFGNLRAIVGLSLALLLAGGLVAVATSAIVGRAVIRGERAIAEQGERLRTTLASIGDAVLTTDTEGRITSLNFVAESLTGWRNAEALGHPLETVFRIVNEETRQTVANPATRALREGVIVGLANHTVLIAKDGAEHFIDDSASPIRCAAGQIVGAVVVFRDVSERRRADVTAARLAAIVESSDDAIIGKNLEGIITSWNTGAEKVFGYTASEMVGQSILRIIPPERRDEEIRILAQVRRGEAVDHFETVRVRKDGRAVHISVTVSPIKNAAGKIVGASKVARDITAAQRTEEALRASEERLRLATDAAGLGIWMWRPDTDQVVWENEWPYQILGVPREEKAINAARFAAEIVHPEDRAAFEGAVAMTLENKARFEFKGRLRRSDGELRWVEFTGKRVPQSNGGSAVLIGTAQNVTAREQAAVSMRQNATLFSTLIEQAPMGTYVVDAQFRLQQVNPEAMPVFTSVNPLIGRDFDEVMELIWGPTVGRECADIFRHTLATGERYISPHFSAQRHDIGEEQAFEWETQRVTLPDGQHGVVCYFHEVTERRRIEAALQQAKDSAEAANASKDRFLAVLSHELRTPLTPVLMVAGALEHDPGLRPDVREDIVMIKRNVELETKLIDDLLDLSRITSGKVELRIEGVDLNESVRQVCGICQPQLAEHRVQLKVKLDHDVHLISADPARLQQVLWNVLKNAIKFTPAEGTVSVSTERLSPARCEVRVQDSGIGIPADILPRIFNAFEQGDTHITRQFGGLGLGLAISRALVELHGGTIRAESEGQGRGATFIVELPGQTPAHAVEAPAADAADDRNAKRIRLLLVEDHADTARALTRFLRAAGMVVSSAGDVASAIAAAERESFDLIVSDLGLPDGDGFEIMRAIRARQIVPGIAMSGYGMDEDIRRSREAGFTEHLVKPVAVPELIAAIRRVTETRA